MKKSKSFIVIGISISLCFFLVVSAVTVLTAKSFSEKFIKNFTAPESYEEIYPLVKKIAKKNDYTAFNYITDIATGGMFAKQEIVLTDDYAAETDTSAHSETTVQVDGVDEADVVKTDGKYIYKLSTSDSMLKIIKSGKEPRLESKINVSLKDYNLKNEMYLYEKFIILTYSGYVDSESTFVSVYDVSNTKEPKKLFEYRQKGSYNTSRMINDNLYLITDYQVFNDNIIKSNPLTYTPSIECKNFNGALNANDIKIYEDCNYPVYTVICGYDITNGKLVGTKAVMCDTYTVYCSTENIIIAAIEDDYNETVLLRYAISEGEIEYKAEGKIKGSLLNQFSIDEYKGNFRFVTTSLEENIVGGGFARSVSSYESNLVHVLNGDLKTIGLIEDVAPNERVYSVRFMGDIAYFVTFRQVDPLFSVDLSNPENPKIIGALKIPGFSDYLFPFGEGKLFGIGQDADEKTGRVGNVKISMFNTLDPKNVTEESKKILLDYDSQALFSHKATFISDDKNLIGFPTSDFDNQKYVIFSYVNNEFVKRAEVILGSDYNAVRGLFIGNEFYVISEYSLIVYNINDFSKICELSI